MADILQPPPLIFEGHYPTEDTYPMERTMTHGSSHYSQPASAHVSRRSWNTPSEYRYPGTGESVVSANTGQTSFYGPRPLSRPDHRQSYATRRPIHYADTIQDEEEPEEEEGQWNQHETYEVPEDSQYAYQPPPPVQEAFMSGALQPQLPEDLFPPHPSPGPQSYFPPPKKKSFVGGFMKGIKRAFGGGKKKRMATPTLPNEAFPPPHRNMPTGNTLPRYLSNSSIGPSNPQFAHRLSVAVAHGSNGSPTPYQPSPPHAMPGTMPGQSPMHMPGMHPPPPGMGPNVMITPPSDVLEADEDDMYTDPTTDHRPSQFVQYEAGQIHHPHAQEQPVYPNEQPQFPQPAYVAVERSTSASVSDSVDPVERTTMMVYTDTQSQAHTGHPSAPTAASSVPQSRPPTNRRVSYAETPIPRRNRVLPQAQTDTTHHTSSIPEEPQSPDSPLTPNHPVLHPMHPQYIYPPAHAPRHYISPPTTSRYTMTSMASHYDPSFASDLTPIEKFFKGLYNLPWIANQRVTVDYRPPEVRKMTSKNKNPKATSWYKTIVDKSRAGLDLLGSVGSPISDRMSLARSISFITSPISRRSRRSRDTRGRHHSSRHRDRDGHRSRSRHHHHRSRRRTGETMDPMAQVYPYGYPPYPYVYPYAPYPTPQAYPQMASPQRSRGHSSGSGGRRSSRRSKRHGEYGYQPMVIPPGPPAMPMYYMNPSPPPHGHGGADPRQQVPGGYVPPMQVSPVFMHYVPNAYHHSQPVQHPQDTSYTRPHQDT